MWVGSINHLILNYEFAKIYNKIQYETKKNYFTKDVLSH